MFMKLHKRSVLMSVLAIGVLSGSVIAAGSAEGSGSGEIKNPVPSHPNRLPPAENIRRELRRLPWQCGSGRGEGRADHLGHRGPGGKQPPDLTDDKTDHGSTDGEIFTVIKKGFRRP